MRINILGNPSKELIMPTATFALLARRILPALAAIALFAAAAPAASAASSIPKSEQGTYTYKSFSVILNGHNEGTDVIKVSIKIGPTGLNGGTKSVALTALKKIPLNNLKITGIKSALTSFSASFTGVTQSGKHFTAGSSVKGTLSSSTLTFKIIFKGFSGSTTLNGTGTYVLKLK
jgi:hypothetical protein